MKFLFLYGFIMSLILFALFLTPAPSLFCPLHSTTNFLQKNSPRRPSRFFSPPEHLIFQSYFWLIAIFELFMGHCLHIIITYDWYHIVHQMSQKLHWWFTCWCKSFILPKQTKFPKWRGDRLRAALNSPD